MRLRPGQGIVTSTKVVNELQATLQHCLHNLYILLLPMLSTSAILHTTRLRHVGDRLLFCRSYIFAFLIGRVVLLFVGLLLVETSCY